MIQSYSQNVTVAQNSAIPFNSTFTKGGTVQQVGAGTFQFNKKGLYILHFDAVVAQSTTAGNITVQMFKDGVAAPEAVTQASSTAATDIEAISFTTRVQVPFDNTDCCNVAPTTVQLRNIGVPALFSQANVVITKLC